MTNKRLSAYTTPRPDIFQLVPENAELILDVGCSNGELGLSLKTARATRKVVGIEKDRALYEAAITRLDDVIRADLDGFDWKIDDKFGLFDCIIFADVLEHTARPEHHVRSSLRYLKPDGTVIVSLPNIQHISALYSIYIKGTFPKRDRGIFDSTHVRWFTIRDGKQLLIQEGLRIGRTSYNLRIFDRGDAVSNKIVRKILGPVQGLSPIKEFLAYQFCISGQKP